MAILQERLRELRKSHKLTQKDVGDYLGISESAYGYYEQGRNEPSLETIKRLAQRYGVNSSYIIGDTDNPSLEEEDKEFHEFINDPKNGVWFKELAESPEEQVEELRKIWEIIKTRESGRRPGDKQK
jgi:transcriptional regulator with XRE-family HTH domain